MYLAMKAVFDKNYENLALVTSDIPFLTKRIIDTAFDLVSQNDLVFGPTLDGGYYVIATKKEKLTKEIFSLSINWSCESVLADSINSIKKNEYKIAFTEKFHDIDSKDDFFWLEKNVKTQNTFSENSETKNFFMYLTDF